MSITTDLRSIPMCNGFLVTDSESIGEFFENLHWVEFISPNSMSEDHLSHMLDKLLANVKWMKVPNSRLPDESQPVTNRAEEINAPPNIVEGIVEPTRRLPVRSSTPYLLEENNTTSDIDDEDIEQTRRPPVRSSTPYLLEENNTTSDTDDGGVEPTRGSPARSSTSSYPLWEDSTVSDTDGGLEPTRRSPARPSTPPDPYDDSDSSYDMNHSFEHVAMGVEWRPNPPAIAYLPIPSREDRRRMRAPRIPRRQLKFEFPSQLSAEKLLELYVHISRPLPKTRKTRTTAVRFMEKLTRLIPDTQITVVLGEILLSARKQKADHDLFDELAEMSSSDISIQTSDDVKIFMYRLQMRMSCRKLYELMGQLLSPPSNAKQRTRKQLNNKLIRKLQARMSTLSLLELLKYVFRSIRLPRPRQRPDLRKLITMINPHMSAHKLLSVLGQLFVVLHYRRRRRDFWLNPLHPLFKLLQSRLSNQMLLRLLKKLLRLPAYFRCTYERRQAMQPQPNVSLQRFSSVLYGRPRFVINQS